MHFYLKNVHSLSNTRAIWHYAAMQLQMQLRKFSIMTFASTPLFAPMVKKGLQFSI